MIESETRAADTLSPEASPPLKVAICRPGRNPKPKHLACVAKLNKAEPDWFSVKLGGPCVDIVRAVIAESALEESPDVLLWVDDDMTFDVTTARVLVEEAHEMGTLVGALYAQKSFGGDWNVQFKDTTPVPCFMHPDAGVFPVHLIGFGMVAMPASMLEDIATKKELPKLKIRDKTYRPWFTCDFRRWESFHSDDYTFCRHAVECGYELFCDTRARVGHLGEHEYQLEDAHYIPPRHDIFEHHDRATVEKEAAE